MSLGHPRPVVPDGWKRCVFDAIHNLSHPGCRATQRLIKRSFVWHKVASDIARWCRECVSCHASKIQCHVKTPVTPMSTPNEAFSHIHVDLVGPLPQSRGHSHLFTIIDRTTRWPEVVPLKDTTAATCVDALIRTWISRFGMPLHITSDRGSQFTSLLWQGMADALGVTLHRTTSYHPQSNELVERFHRCLKASLRARLSGPDWMGQLPWIMLGLRNSPKEDTDVSPAEAVLRAQPMLPGQFVSPSRQTSVNPVIPVRHHGVPHASVPDAVRSASHAFLRVDSYRTPLQRPYQGPYPIVRRDDKTCTLLIRDRESVVSMDRIKPAHVPADDAAPHRPPATVQTRSGRSVHPPLRYQGGS